VGAALMFIGHFAVGFAAKRVLPDVSLAALFAGAQLADLVWPFCLALGLEEVEIVPGSNPLLVLNFIRYPYTHSLVTLIVWGVVFGWICRVLFGGRRTVAIIAMLVVSHWVLDVVTHRPDMPIYPGGPTVGLGLWNSVPSTLGVEVAMYVTGAWLYATFTRARDSAGRWGFVSLAVLLGAAYLASLMGPPPPSVPALYASAIVGSGVILLWSWWADFHRDPRVSPASSELSS
jgi:hypothetical protein